MTKITGTAPLLALLVLVVAAHFCQMTLGQTPPPSNLNYTTPPPCLMTCSGLYDNNLTQSLFAGSGWALQVMCDRLTSAMGWNGCGNSSQFLYYTTKAISDGGYGLCNSPVTVTTMVNRYGSAIAIPGAGWGYYALCQPCTLGLGLNCSRSNCGQSVCSADQACTTVGATFGCYCNSTGNLTLGACPTPTVSYTTAGPAATVVITQPPTQSSLILQEQEGIQKITIIVGVIGGLFVLLCIVVAVVLWRLKPEAQKGPLVSLAMSLFDLLTDLALCYTLFKTPDLIPTSYGDVYRACSYVQVLTICVGASAGTGIFAYAVMKEWHNGGFVGWAQRYNAVVGTMLIFCMVDPSNIRLYSSDIFPFLNYRWSPAVLRAVDITGLVLIAVRDLPQIAIQIVLITVTVSDPIPFIALVVSMMNLFMSIGRRAASMSIWTRLHARFPVGSFKTPAETSTKPTTEVFDMTTFGTDAT